ncbi:hypothetical protein HPB47_021876 [Ixodes persulcatus]|uniref:Uncharacterized protein n=1 Tax=Ixodes persulcatus TaxID=34615 RepID=A0AC60QBG2_IXOPE|nr:hypothetical protein HPB47_021876 [Ixodes persulcatus]
MYLDKRIHYKNENYDLRQSLAVLDWNEHVGREHTSVYHIEECRHPDRQGGKKKYAKKSYSAGNRHQSGNDVILSSFDSTCTVSGLGASELDSEAPELRAPEVTFGRPVEGAGVDQKIATRIGPAKETLDALIAEGQAGTFDFVFIDADKVNYDVYYEKSLQLVRKNGIIAIDNVFMEGNVYGTIDNPEYEKETVALRALNRKLHRDDRIHLCMLTMADGVTLALKK